MIAASQQLRPSRTPVETQSSRASPHFAAWSAAEAKPTTAPLPRTSLAVVRAVRAPQQGSRRALIVSTAPFRLSAGFAKL